MFGTKGANSRRRVTKKDKNKRDFRCETVMYIGH